MDQKIDLVIDSIKKLLALSVSEEDIIKELNGVGITNDAAIELIAKAKEVPGTSSQKPVTPLSSSSSSKDVFDKTVSDLSMDDQIVTQLGVESTQEVSTQNASKQVRPAEPKKVPQVNINPSEVDFGLTIKESTKTPKSTSGKINAEASDEDDEETIGSVLKSISKDRGVNTTSSSQLSGQEKIGQDSTQTQVKKSVVQKTSDLPMYDSVKKPSFQSDKKYSSSTSISSPESSVDTNVDDFWKKGVIVAVNSRLAEMKKLKEDIDSIVQEKVDSSVRKELSQFKVLMDSQKELMISSNKSALEEKQKEITFIIDAKIAELKQYNKQLSENLSAIESAKLEQQAALEQIRSSLDEARKIKSQLIIEMNSEIVKSKSSAQNFLDTADRHMKDLDERVNRTLELEKNIAEGMLAQAEQKIEGLTIQRADELIEELEVTLNKLKTSEAQLNPELLQQKIQVLDDFKKQFVNTMKDNITQINVAINELNERNVSIDRAIQEKMLVLDAKIEELTKFEKNFTATMESSFRK